jgi:hypothetical protein
MLLDPILGRVEPLKVISRKSRGGLYISKPRLSTEDSTYGGGTLCFFSFLRLNNIHSRATIMIPPTAPPTIPPIAPPLSPEDLELPEAAAEAIVAGVVLAADAELAEEDTAAEEACEAGAAAELEAGTAEEPPAVLEAATEETGVAGFGPACEAIMND